MRQPFKSLVVGNITEEKEEHKYLRFGERPENIGFLEQEIYNKKGTQTYFSTGFNKLNGIHQFFNEPLENWKITYKSNIRNILKNEAYQDYIELEHPDLSVKLHIKTKFFCENLNKLTIENGVIKNKIIFLYDKEDLFLVPEGTLEYVTALKSIAGVTEIRLPKPGEIVSLTTYDYSKMVYLGKSYKTDCNFLAWFSLINYFKNREQFNKNLDFLKERNELFSTTSKPKHIFACLKGNKVEFIYVSVLKKMSILDSLNFENFKFEDITMDLEKEEVFIPVLNWTAKIFTYSPYSYVSNSAFHEQPKPSEKQIEELLKNRTKFYTEDKFNTFLIKHDRHIIPFKDQLKELKKYILDFLDEHLSSPKERVFSQLRGTIGQLIKEG